MARTVRGSKMRVISRNRPPNAGHASTLRANTRDSNIAQLGLLPAR
jgi:hypothetical protein